MLAQPHLSTGHLGLGRVIKATRPPPVVVAMGRALCADDSHLKCSTCLASRLQPQGVCAPGPVPPPHDSSSLSPGLLTSGEGACPMSKPHSSLMTTCSGHFLQEAFLFGPRSPVTPDASYPAGLFVQKSVPRPHPHDPEGLPEGC